MRIVFEHFILYCQIDSKLGLFLLNRCQVNSEIYGNKVISQNVGVIYHICCFKVIGVFFKYTQTNY